jgi:hypothetical protein
VFDVYEMRAFQRRARMTTRMTQRTVVFSRPFVLGGFERIEPAGSYLVETEEERNEDVDAWRKCATIIHVTRDGDTKYVRIDVTELDKALTRDAAPEETPEAMALRLDLERRRGNARPARRKKF